MNPKIWGPFAWTFLHYITLDHPNKPTKDDRDNLLNFFNIFQSIIPCQVCKKNFRRHLDEFPLTDEILLDNQKTINWLFKMHNRINDELGKRRYLYDEFHNKYHARIKSDQDFLNLEIRIWYLFKYIILNYPLVPLDSDKNNMNDFFEILKIMFPVGLVKDNYLELIKINPLNDKILSSRKYLYNWYLEMDKMIKNI